MTDRERCPTCGQFVRREITFGDRMPSDVPVLRARILSLEAQYAKLDARNTALSQVAAQQARRLVTMAEQIHESSHETRVRREA